MFVSIGKTLASRALVLAANVAQAAGMIALMRKHNIKSFANKFHQLQVQAAARGHKGRYRRTYQGGGSNLQATQRRHRQNAHQHQLDSHKPGTVQPAHIFGAVHGN
jgi:hypothetical protein